MSKVREKHGYSYAPVYMVWSAMKARCLNKKNKEYGNYGGRGIKVCKRWLDFTNFISDIGEPPPKTTLERIDNNKGYSPGNCKWATHADQSRNQRRNKMITWDGETKCVTDWARALSKSTGINETTILGRLSRGMSLGDEALKSVFAGGTFITFNGKTKNISQWARSLGLDQSTLSERLKNGWSLEKALSADDTRKGFITFNGQTKHIAEWVRQTGLSRFKLWKGLKDGLSIDLAFEQALKKGRKANVLITFNGQTKCIADWARQLSLKPCTLERRLKMGWSVERSLTSGDMRKFRAVKP